jgi:hypothetical protein
MSQVTAQPSKGVGLLGLLLPFLVVMIPLLFIGHHTAGEDAATVISFLGIPLLIVGVRRRAARTHVTP